MGEIDNRPDYLTYIRSMTGHKLIFMSAACALVTDSEGRLLLQKRESGKWGLPGGLAELGESMAETAEREVYEETGLKIRAKELWGVYSKYQATCANGDELQPVVTLFLAETVGGELTADGKETLALRYFAQDELPEIYCEQHTDMVRDYFEGRKGSFR